jgi:glycosyltransferase involved in cell wall biosynthesis
VLAGSPGYRAGEVLGDDVVSLGRVEEADLVDLYRAAEVLAAPALYEGFGLPPLEAMACGTPVVVAAGSGGLVEVSGPAAVVAADRRAETWVDAIERARERRDELARGGLEHSAAFRWPAAAEATLRVLRSAASGGTP